MFVRLSLEMTLSSLTRVGGTHSDGSSDGLHVENVFGLLSKQAGRCLLLGMGAGKNEQSRSSLCNVCTDRSLSARYIADAWAPISRRPQVTVIL